MNDSEGQQQTSKGQQQTSEPKRETCKANETTILLRFSLSSAFRRRGLISDIPEQYTVSQCLEVLRAVCLGGIAGGVAGGASDEP